MVRADETIQPLRPKFKRGGENRKKNGCYSNISLNTTGRSMFASNLRGAGFSTKGSFKGSRVNH